MARSRKKSAENIYFLRESQIEGKMLLISLPPHYLDFFQLSVSHGQYLMRNFIILNRSSPVLFINKTIRKEIFLLSVYIYYIWSCMKWDDNAYVVMITYLSCGNRVRWQFLKLREDFLLYIGFRISNFKLLLAKFGLHRFTNYSYYGIVISSIISLIYENFYVRTRTELNISRMILLEMTSSIKILRVMKALNQQTIQDRRNSLITIWLTIRSNQLTKME